MTVSTLHKTALRLLVLIALIAIPVAPALAQALGAGTVAGTVVDPNNAVVPNANVTIANPVTGYTRSAVTNHDGTFRFVNAPPYGYHVVIQQRGLGAHTQ